MPSVRGEEGTAADAALAGLVKQAAVKALDPYPVVDAQRGARHSSNDDT